MKRNRPKLSGEPMADLSKLELLELVWELYERNTSLSDIEGLYGVLDIWADNNPVYIADKDSAVVKIS